MESYTHVNMDLTMSTEQRRLNKLRGVSALLGRALTTHERDVVGDMIDAGYTPRHIARMMPNATHDGRQSRTVDGIVGQED